MPFIFSLYRNAFANLQRNIWILSITMFINRSGSMVLLFTSLYLTKQLHFSIAQAGFIMSFYGAGSILGSYTGGWLTDRRNYFDIMLWSLIGCGMILLLMLTTTSSVLITAIIFCYGFAADMFRPANSVAIAAYTNPDDRARSISLVRLAVNLGFSVGPAIGGFIALYLGYKWLFVVDAFTSFGAAIILYKYLPRQKAEKNRHDNPVLNDSSTSAYRDFKYLTFILLAALYFTSFTQLFASIPQYFNRECHYNEDTIGLLLALNGLLVVIIEMPLISILEKRKKSFRFIIMGTLCLPAAFLILQLGKGMIIWSVLYTLIITMSEILAMPFLFNHAISQPLKERQGQYSALYSIAFGIAVMIAPSLGLGIAARYGFDNMFYFFIALSFVVALGFGLLRRKNKTALSNPV